MKWESGCFLSFFYFGNNERDKRFILRILYNFARASITNTKCLKKFANNHNEIDNHNSKWNATNFAQRPKEHTQNRASEHARARMNRTKNNNKLRRMNSKRWKIVGNTDGNNYAKLIYCSWSFFFFSRLVRSDLINILHKMANKILSLGLSANENSFSSELCNWR